jgi:N-acetylglucosaminyldiphosphoundecaprenol N-acetyl-beta-D-mannosaminyltransferase
VELKQIPVRRLFEVPVHAATMEQAVDVCRQAIEEHRQLMIGVVNAAKIVNMKHEPSLNESVVGSDLILADGMAVVWASRVLRQPLPERVAGIDLFERLLELASKNGYRVFFLGATQEVLDEMIRRLAVRLPDLRVAGAQHGYFSAQESGAIAQRIHDSGADLLFVAMTSPKKEIFLREWGTTTAADVCHGVGGSFDVLAGKVTRAPAIWQKCGLEWLYRTLQEPRRMWKRYLVTNSVFLWMLFRELFRSLKTPRVR